MGNPQIARLEATWAAVTLGKWAFTIVLGLYAYRAGGAGAVGVATAVRALPAAFGAPYVALLVDRSSRRMALLVSTAARGAIMTVIAIAVAGSAPLALVLALAALFTIVDTAHRPAQAALFARVARTPSELAAANVLGTVLDNTGFLLGALLVGATVALAGLAMAFAVLVAPFVAAFLLVSTLAADPPPAAVPTSESAPAEILEGVRSIRAHRDLRGLLWLFGADRLVQGMIDVLLVIAALELLDMGQGGAGWLNAGWAVGGVAGGAAATVLLHRGRLPAGLLAGCALLGLPLVALGVWPNSALAVALLALFGAGTGLVEVAHNTLVQRLAAADVLARVYGVDEVVEATAAAIGALVAAALVDWLGVDGAVIAAGAIPLAALALLGRRLAQMESGIGVPEEAFTLLRGVHIFASLPMATVETLAMRARPQELAAGETIISQGEAGDAFHVIGSGHVEVFVDGAYRRTQGSGEYFGEIALLRDVPRTATVTATEPVSLLTLDRDEFLAGIGSHAYSRRELERVAETRLAATAGS
jgi:predicted MFS family arabinose efflux permease